MGVEYSALLALVRAGIGHSFYSLPEIFDWNEIKELAYEQGVSAIVVDGIDRLADKKRPAKELLLEWIGDVLQNYEQRYESYCSTIAEMAGWHNAHGYKMMVLKGYACGLSWPKPEHRPYGDIDIWQFGKQREADKVLIGKGIEVDNSHHHHSVFYWGEFMVENHYDFINVYHHQSNRGLEAIFKELGVDDSHYVEVTCASTGSVAKVYLPSPNLHALFLLKHMMNDFTSFSMNLRQLLDWAFFVEKHTKEIDWKWLVGVLEKYHMLDFLNTINAICVENLGFEASIFYSVQYKPELKDRVLNDILEPEFTVEEPSSLIPRLMYKYKRWRGNAWKHEMCYNESMWSAFWSGVLGHLLKPASI